MENDSTNNDDPTKNNGAELTIFLEEIRGANKNSYTIDNMGNICNNT